MGPISDKQRSQKIRVILSSSKRQTFLAALRCLIPNREQMLVRWDQKRLCEELRFMKYYADRNDNRSLISAGAPVIFVNRDRAVMQEELAILYEQMAGKKPEVMQQLAFYMLIDFLHGEDVKRSLVCFHPLLKGNDEIVQFQKAKIHLLMRMGKEAVVDILPSALYTSQEMIDSEKILLQNLGKADRLSQRSEDPKEQTIMDFLSDLRNFRVQRKLYQKQSNPMDVIVFEEGKTYHLPPLGEVCVIEKTLRQEILEVKLKAKSEIYLFRYRK